MGRQNLDLGFLGKSHVLAPLAQRARAAPPRSLHATDAKSCTKVMNDAAANVFMTTGLALTT
jgi:hypothetical protein